MTTRRRDEGRGKRRGQGWARRPSLKVSVLYFDIVTVLTNYTTFAGNRTLTWPGGFYPSSSRQW